MPSAEAASYIVRVEEDSIFVSLSANFRQNITLLVQSFSFPHIEGKLSGDNATEASQALQAALREKAPKVSVKDLEVSASAWPWSNVTESQWLNVTISFQLSGAVQNRGDAAAADVAWKSFIVREDILVGGLSVNSIGDKYLAKLPPELAVAPGSPVGGLSFTVDGFPASHETLFELLQKVNAMDFSAFRGPLSEWESSLDFDTATTVWRIDPGPRTVLSIILGLAEPTPFPTRGITVEIDYELVSQISAEVRVPGRAFAEEDVIVFDSRTAVWPMLFLAAIMIPLAIFLVTSLIEKRLLSHSSPKLGRGKIRPKGRSPRE